MIRRLFLLTLLLVGSAITASAASEEIIQRHFTAAPGGKVIVDVDFGVVEITGGADDKTIGVNARRSVDIADKAREKEFIAAAPITITEENNVLTLRAHSDRKWKWNDSHTRMNAHYSVQVPKNFNADLHTGGGEISVSDLTGHVVSNSAGGRLKFTRVHGPTDGRTSGGAVELTDCEGTIKIQTAGGHIDSMGGNGSLDAQTAGGQMSVRGFAGRIDISSNGGQLRLDQITGPLNAKTLGGEINAAISSATDVKLETNAGAITVAVPANGGFNVDARSTIGDVSTDLPVNAKHKDRETLVGSLNEGGKTLFLRTGAGSIHIKAAGAQTASR
ncbi:MAG TPA: DUF4097 family beta strand repeat-containing protein [Chthoniobacterales bacterium]|jgi:hypothetical protein